MELSKRGQFELSVTDVDGVESDSQITGSITVTQDQRPVVRIVQPQPISIATPDIKLPVIVLADDDYGITRLTLFRSLNGSPATSVDATLDETARVEHRWELPLMDYGLEPGDEIQLFARAEDNDPHGAKGAESPVTLIRIISVEEFQKLIIQQKGAESIQAKYQMARRYFDQVSNALREVQEAAKELEASPDSEAAAQKLQEKLNAAEQAAQQAAQEVAKLSEQPMPIDVDQDLAKTLKEMSSQANDMKNKLAEMKQNAKPNLNDVDQQAVEKMLDEATGNQKELTENAIDPLGQMQKMMPLLMDEQRFTQLVQQQRDLAERLKALQNADRNDPKVQRRVSELESEQEQLKQLLGDLLDEIERHAQELPENPKLDKLRQSSQDFAKALRESTATKEMEMAQQELLADEFSEAQSQAEKAAQTLEKFMGQCKGMGNQACKDCEASFNPQACNFGDSINQMLDMMGMKNKSGRKPGGNPGQGFGFGQGNGYSQRSPGPQNVGMYGSMPTPQPSASQGRGDRKSQGFQTSQAIDTTTAGSGDADVVTKGESSGQSLNAVPPNYRSKVAEYLRNLSEQIGNTEREQE